jgi:lipid II:glycine glycyltransferase (peptidoglycan interpeptide bridge formation enzyme)
MTTIYYVKQFNLYYAGTDPDGTINLANERRDAVALTNRDAAIKKCEELGKEHCEIEERNL